MTYQSSSSLLSGVLPLPQLPVGTDINKIQLAYVTTTDVNSGTAISLSTWTNVGTPQNFTVDQAGSSIDVFVGGLIRLIISPANFSMSRLVVDGTSFYNLGTSPSGTDVNCLGSPSPATVTGLVPGVHTVQVQAYAWSAGNIFVRSALNAPIEAFHIQVVERK